MMDKRVVALVAAAGGLLVGVAGAGMFMRAQAAPPPSACPAYDAKVDANINAEVKRLHAHDRDQYVPHPAQSPFGDSPKSSSRGDSANPKP